jgi:putative ABC transport system substrate-binding protein
MLPIIGFISTGSAASFAPLVAAFHRGLNENGYIDGQNVKIEYRWAEGRYDQLPGLAAELVQREVSVIAALTPPAAQAAKAATSTIPVIFMTGTDPVKLGLVSNLNRPGGNVTGATFISTGLEPKRMELLHELVPEANTVAVLVNPNFPEAQSQLKDLSTAAHAIGLNSVSMQATGDESSISAAFADIVKQRLGAVLLAADPFFYALRDHLVALAARHAVPTAYFQRDFVIAGGLMSYGTSVTDTCRQSGLYVGRVLKGDKPADLPVIRPTKFEFVINLKAAKALGLTVPVTLQVAADEVIE